MTTDWTTEQIIAMASDDYSVQAARALAKPHKWVSLGYNERAIWGVCRVSARAPYLTQIDATVPAFRCTCTSRKHPCKHALGLFLLLASKPTAFTKNMQPKWVTDWLNARAQSRRQRVRKREHTGELANPTAQAGRAAKPPHKIPVEFEELGLQLRDLVKQWLTAERIAHVGSWVLNPAKNELKWSDEIYRILGLKPREFGVTYEAFLERVHPEDREYVNQGYQELVKYKKPYNVVHRIVRPDGEVRYVHGKAEYIVDENGSRSIGTLQDITEQRKSKEELQKAHDDMEIRVAERTQELAQAYIQLQELDRLKGMFIASMSHELRTPLNSIIGFTGLLLMGIAGDLNEEQKKQLNVIKNNADHLLGLINDILDISKIEAGKVDLLVEEFEIAEVVNDVVATALPLAENKEFKLLHDVPEGMKLNSDKRRVKQILMNLVSNAIKFTDKGNVKITVKSSNIRYLEIIVSDTGIGIRKEDMEKLFKPFQQIDTSSTKKYEGTGLGLYLCKKLVALLHGDISVKSRYGKGSEFQFILPL